MRTSYKGSHVKKDFVECVPTRGYGSEAFRRPRSNTRFSLGGGWGGRQSQRWLKLESGVPGRRMVSLGEWVRSGLIFTLGICSQKGQPEVSGETQQSALHVALEPSVGSEAKCSGPSSRQGRGRRLEEEYSAKGEDKNQHQGESDCFLV